MWVRGDVRVLGHNDSHGEEVQEATGAGVQGCIFSAQWETHGFWMQGTRSTLRPVDTGAAYDGLGKALRELSRSPCWSSDDDLLIILIVENVSIWLRIKLPAEAEAYGWDGL